MKVNKCHKWPENTRFPPFQRGFGDGVLILFEGRDRVRWVKLLFLFQDSALDLILFDRLKQGSKITFAESFIAFALYEFEKNGPDHRFREDLQKDFGHAAINDAFAINQNAMFAHAIQRLGVPLHPIYD